MFVHQSCIYMYLHSSVQVELRFADLLFFYWQSCWTYVSWNMKFQKIVKILIRGGDWGGVVVYLFTDNFLIFNSIFIWKFKKGLRQNIGRWEGGGGSFCYRQQKVNLFYCFFFFTLTAIYFVWIRPKHLKSLITKDV